MEKKWEESEKNGKKMEIMAKIVKFFPLLKNFTFDCFLQVFSLKTLTDNFFTDLTINLTMILQIFITSKPIDYKNYITNF